MSDLTMPEQNQPEQNQSEQDQPEKDQPEGAPSRPAGIRLAALPGATPDKWAHRWRERYRHIPLSVDYYDDDARQPQRLEAGLADVGYVRVRAEQDVDTDVLHRVWLYEELPVVCAAAEHWVAAAEDVVPWAEIEQESFFTPDQMVEQDPEPDVPKTGAELGRGERMALEVVASGAGLLILPNSVARMLSRKDVVIRTVEGLPGWQVGLAWLRERDSEDIQEFVGIARGRKPGSGRSELQQTRSAAPKKADTKGSGKAKGAKGATGKPAAQRRGAASRGSKPAKGRKPSRRR